MKGKEVIHNSNSNDEWGTPPAFFNLLDRFFHFDLDVAATKKNTLCKKYLEDDALHQDWIAGQRIWCNPPYSRGNIDKFITKAIKESDNCTSIVVLTTAKTDTIWFHKALGKCTTCYLIKGRLKFVAPDVDSCAPFPSALWVFGRDFLKEKKGWKGKILPLRLKPKFRGL